MNAAPEIALGEALRARGWTISTAEILHGRPGTAQADECARQLGLGDGRRGGLRQPDQE